MANEITVWVCQFCGVHKNTKTVAERHEKACLGNPDGQNCLMCVHCVETKEAIYDEGFYSMITATKTVRRCKIRNIHCSKSVSANCDFFERKDDLCRQD